MKQSCLFLIFVFIGVFCGYWYLLKETEFSSQYWIPILFGLGAVMIVGNIQGIFLAIKQRRAGSKAPNQLRDGEYAAVSGTIQALRTPIIAPFSGTASCMVEYAIKGGSHGSAAGDYIGFLMTPSVVQTFQGSVRVVGFPLLAEIQPQEAEDSSSYQRAGEYLSKTTFKEKSSNPLSLLSQLNTVLSGDDGEVKADFCVKDAKLHLGLEESSVTTTDREIDEDIDEDKTDSDEEDSSLGEDLVETQPATRAQQIAGRLEAAGYILEETLIKNGEEVTAFGTYRQSRQAIDIGSGLKDITHSLKRGNLSRNTGKLLMQSVITLIIIGALSTAGNLYLFQELGIDIKKVILNHHF